MILINIDLFHIFGSFLDVTFLRKLSVEKIETLVKKKFTCPITVVNSSSMTPNRSKYCTLYSELLRIRRISSKKEFIALYDRLLSREFYTQGYLSVDSKIKFYIEQIDKNFDVNFVKIPKETKKSLVVYGAVSIFDSVTNSHRIVRKILRDSLTIFDANMPTLIPSNKLKMILHTKKRYLLKMKNA